MCVIIDAKIALQPGLAIELRGVANCNLYARW
jgi:hypothetical protein